MTPPKKNSSLIKSKSSIDRSHNEIERSNIEKSHVEIEKSQNEIERSNIDIENSHNEILELDFASVNYQLLDSRLQQNTEVNYDHKLKYTMARLKNKQMNGVDWKNITEQKRVSSLFKHSRRPVTHCSLSKV